MRDIDELPPPRGIFRIDRIVVEQPQAAPAGQQQVWPAVAVEVADGRPVTVEPVAVDVEPLADILERAVAEIAIELAGPAVDRLALEETAARKEDVEPLVAIEVEQGDATAERFEDGQVARFGTVAIAEIDAGGCGDIPEESGPVFLRGGRHASRWRPMPTARQREDR